MRLYRVFPYDPGAAQHNEGGALYIPPASLLGRIANVDLYRELYFGALPETAVAESFGFSPAWYADDFIHASGRPFALAAYGLANTTPIFNLNDTSALAAAGIPAPSMVVTRQRAVTQQWARRIYGLRRYAGVAWWSYYGPDCMVYGLWNVRSVRLAEAPQILTTAHPAVVAAATAIVRQIP